MKLKYKHLFWIFALLTAISFDQLFWEQAFGINFIIFAVLAALAGLIPFWLEKIRIPWTSYLLLVPIGGFSMMTFIRAEPFITALNVLLTFSALCLFLITLQNGAWYQYRLRDHLLNWAHFFMNSVIGGILFFSKIKKVTPLPSAEGQVENEASDITAETGEEKSEKPNNKALLKTIAPYLRGLLLALPILAFLALLLAQADPIFNDRLQNLFSRFRIENLGETLFRVFYILVISYVLLSAYTFALLESKKYEKKDKDKSGINPFLGSIESHMVMIGVNLLFLAFVILQFNYLFSGGENISIEGYTYAEYARRGFFELLAVAIISLLLFYILSIITKREAKNQQRIFSVLGLTLVGLVGLILVSAYTRLTLYEIAYGFTRLRTLAHIFMIWIGLLLVAIAVLEITKNITKLAFILICFILGFGITINILNIDRFIVQQNVTRAIAGDQETGESNLDSGYLASLSNDAVPQLVEFYKDPDLAEELQNEIGGVLACKSAMADDQNEESWVSFHLSRRNADVLFQNQEKSLEQYPVTYDEYTWFVEVNGEVKSCRGYEPAPFD